MKNIIIMLCVCYFSLYSSLFSDWNSFTKDLTKQVKQITETSSSKDKLSVNTIALGLQEALDKGVNQAIEGLSKSNGYYSDPQVKIPLPRSISKAKKLLKSVGQEKIVTDFEKSMNRAAEQAAPLVLDIFVNSIKKMTFEDARQILEGTDTAATDYLYKKNNETLTNLIKPKVKQVMDSNKVTGEYKKLVIKAKKADKIGVLKDVLKKDAFNLDDFVTRKAIDGIFIKLADEEKKIRRDPVQQTTKLLKQVFS